MPGGAVAGVADAKLAALGVGDVDQEHQPHMHVLLRLEAVVGTDGHGAHRWNQKTALYEECVRIPFIISSKDSARVGAVDGDYLVSMGLDLIPTMCDYAGIEPPAHLSGQSLRPLLEGRPSSCRDQLTIETNVDIGSGPGGQLVARAMRTERYKYSVYPMGWYREQLVDLEADPGEMVNLAVSARSRDILDDHRQRLRKWCEETDDPFLQSCVR